MPCSSALNVNSSLCVERLVCAIYINQSINSIRVHMYHSISLAAATMLYIVLGRVPV